MGRKPLKGSDGLLARDIIINFGALTPQAQQLVLERLISEFDLEAIE